MIVGIDLGTTNSLVGIFNESGVELIPNALGELLTPSVVSLDEKGRVLVGRAARERLVSHPNRTAASFKRFMGSNRQIHLKDRSFRAEELSALVLRSLVGDVEARTGGKVEEAVISVPAYFGDAQRKATRAAGQLAGIRVERLVNEPTAAALAYGLESRLDGTTVIVLDLGGGTFDVSILEAFEGVMRVHASAGDNRLGGDDFTRALYDQCTKDLGLPESGASAEDVGQRLAAMERVKQQLGTTDVAEARFLVGSEQKTWSITEERFAQLADPLLQRIRRPIERAMRDARLGVSDLAEIVLVGGATRMPCIARMVVRMFGRLPLRHINPDEAIARGAAVAAGMKARHAALEEIVMTDVCPYTLGVAVAIEDGRGGHTTGHYSPIIERNLTVPTSRSSTYYPVQARQRMLELEVYQGESPFVANNVLLGKLEVKLPVGVEQNQAGVEVRFTYDVNGVLQVEAKVLHTGAVSEIILTGDNAGMGMDEIRQRLQQLAGIKVHPRDAQENLATIARAERLYEESLGDERAFLQAWLARFKGEVERQDPGAIAAMREELEYVLSQMESSRL
jgi:molecular chaperone HscC